MVGFTLWRDVRSKIVSNPINRHARARRSVSLANTHALPPRTFFTARGLRARDRSTRRVQTRAPGCNGFLLEYRYSRSSKIENQRPLRRYGNQLLLELNGLKHLSAASNVAEFPKRRSFRRYRYDYCYYYYYCKVRKQHEKR